MRTVLGRVRALVPAVFGLLLLAGCVDGTGSGGLLTGAGGGPVYRSAKVAQGSVVIRGPSGYCVEGRSLRSTGDDGFGLLARCDILSQGKLGSNVALAMLTVTVTPYQGADLPSARELAGDFAKGEVIEAVEAGSVRLLHLRHGGDVMVQGADPRQWRAVFVLNGHLVSLAAYGPRDSRVADQSGKSLVLSTVRAMRSASPRGKAVATAG